MFGLRIPCGKQCAQFLMVHGDKERALFGACLVPDICEARLRLRYDRLCVVLIFRLRWEYGRACGCLFLVHIQ